MLRRMLVLLMLLLASLQRPLEAAPLDFDGDIKTLLVANCLPCHAESNRTSGFSVGTLESVLAGGNGHGRAVQPGHPDQSVLIRVLRGQLPPIMPLGRALPEADIARIEEWIRNLPPETTAKAGETWTWPFRKPADPKVPAVQNTAWVSNPIDAFILEKLEARKLTPAPPAAKRILARRLHFDLVGMPPSPEEMNAFLNDSSSGAYEQLVDRLLADSRYGERWARYWLDLVRYAETEGLEGDAQLGRSGPLSRLTKTGGNPWRYRDWVIDAFNSDLPYDRFVLLQVGGADEHSKTRSSYLPEIRNHIPLGFLRIAPWDVEDFQSEQQRQAYLNEVTATTASVFLGLTLGCAQCHDHKYDPIPAKDFYRFQAFFNAIYVSDVEVPFEDEAFREKAEAKIQHYTQCLKDGAEKKALDAFAKALLDKLISLKIQEAAGRDLESEDLRLELRSNDSKIFTRAELAQHAELLARLQRKGDLEEKEVLEAFEKSVMPKLRQAYERKLVDPLDRFWQLTVADVRGAMRNEYGESKYFTLEEKEEWQKLSDQVEVLKRRLSRWQPIALTVTNVLGPPVGPPLPPTYVLHRGDYRQPREAVEPGFPSSITGNSGAAVIETDRYRQFPTRGRRITLARWIASPGNPTTARVMVNRIWQHHYGRGIVGTPNDFGRNGERPTHPELLDWLSHRFIESQWSIKAMHRLILTSNTWRQATDNPQSVSAGTGTEPDNRLLWHFTRRRHEAEVIRDSMLFLSGRLNLERGGPNVFPPLPERIGRSG